MTNRQTGKPCDNKRAWCCSDTEWASLVGATNQFSRQNSPNSRSHNLHHTSHLDLASVIISLYEKHKTKVSATDIMSNIKQSAKQSWHHHKLVFYHSNHDHLMAIPDGGVLSLTPSESPTSLSLRVSRTILSGIWPRWKLKSSKVGCWVVLNWGIECSI
jgi:hypothetical protein